jgi:hypothetical protein
MSLPDSVHLNAWLGRGKPSQAKVVEKVGPWLGINETPKVPEVLAVKGVRDERDWTDPRIGWSLLLPHRNDLDSTALASPADAPPAIHRLWEKRGRPPIYRYDASAPDRAGYVRRYAPDGNQEQDLDDASSCYGFGVNALPFYLLIYGGPDEVPWDLQRRLNGNRAVGRLVELPDGGLDRYVDHLIKGWPDSRAEPKAPLVWSTGHDWVTKVMWRMVGEPLNQWYARQKALKARAVGIFEEHATSTRLAEMLRDRTPGLIVTTSHGDMDVTRPEIDRRIGLPVDGDGLSFDADALLGAWQPDGAIWFALACCSAGTDRPNGFDGLLDPNSDAHAALDAVATQLGARVAPWPLRLLAADRPARAFIGHVEPTFDRTMRDDRTKQSLMSGVVEALTERIYNPNPLPVGFALRPHYRPLANLYDEDSSAARALNKAEPDAEVRLLDTRLRQRDLRGLMLLGDPTAALGATRPARKRSRRLVEPAPRPPDGSDAPGPASRPPDATGSASDPTGRRGIDQRHQKVQGAQTNIAGDARAPVLTGSFSGSVWIGTTEPIDWNAVDYKPHLKRVRDRFIQHMTRFAGARSEQDAVGRYLPLRLQETQYPPSDAQAGEKRRVGVSGRRVGVWTELVQNIGTQLVIGGAGGGKTTKLLHIAWRLADEALRDPSAPLPVYLSLRAWLAQQHVPLRELVAKETGLDPRVIDALWGEPHRPLYLILDGFDEVPAVRVGASLAELAELYRPASPGRHGLIVSCRPGKVLDELRETHIPFYELMLMSLSDREIDLFLSRYGVPELASSLDARFREIGQNPDILSALAQYAMERSEAEMPRSAGQVYAQLVDRHLFSSDAGEYDYWRVKRPVLAHFAFTMLERKQGEVIRDDALDEQVARQLEGIARRYDRRRTVMPVNWTAQGLLDELMKSPVLEQRTGREERLAFSKLGYCEFFAAVHLQISGVTSDEVQRLLPTLDRERWMQPLINLIGLQPEASALFDALYGIDTQLAAQLWFESRPPGVQGPQLLRDEFDRRLARPSPSPLVELEEPVTTGLLARLLKSRDPRERLQAAASLTQWGLSTPDALLDAAEDEHPLVQAVARYALIHLGESAPGSESGRPLPPVIQADRSSLAFRTFGGCNARIGPLNLVQVPEPVTAQLALDIERLDFDPFEIDSDFAFAPTPSSLLATRLFDGRHGMDWIDLTACYRWIAGLLVNAARKAEGRAGLSGLADLLRRQAVAYVCLGKLLARDLGVTWKPLELPDAPNRVAQTAQDVYEQLRRLYNRGNLSRTITPADPGPDSKDNIHVSDPKATVKQTIGSIKDGGKVLGIRFDDELRIGDSPDGDPDRKLKYIDLATNQVVDKIDHGNLSSINIHLLRGTKQELPVRLSIEGSIHVDRAFSAHIDGLLIDRVEGGTCGWSASYSVAIERFHESYFSGIVVKQFDQEVAKSPEEDPIAAGKRPNELIAISDTPGPTSQSLDPLEMPP